jgi:pimeloyl-ACP methyl ester carboxylesterase
MGKIIGVHGFNFDPDDAHNDPWKLYHDWSVMLLETVQGFAWYSSTPTVKGVVKAWLHGYADRYAYAYKKLALDAAEQLAQQILAQRFPVRLICHSLGSRVVLQALTKLPAGKVERIIILDGAELQGEAAAALTAAAKIGPLPKILNICVRHDRVLKDLGSWASGECGECIGLDGLGAAGKPFRDRWLDVFLDDAKTQAFALQKPREWGLNAVDPLDLGGHWESYTIQTNWPLYRNFMRGDDLADFRRFSAAA